MIVEVPGLGKVEFPDGTSPEVMRNAIQKAIQKQNIEKAKAGTLELSPARAARQAQIDAEGEAALRDPGAWSAISAGGAQGMTFGFADELLGGVRAGVGAVGDVLSGNTAGMMGRMGNNYASMRDAVRGNYENAKFARPVTTMASEIIGGVAPAMAGIGLAVNPATSLAARTGMGALAGAGEGALYGFGSGQGGFGDRMGSAATGAAMGAMGGAVAPAIMSGLGAIKNAAVSAFGGASDAAAGKAINEMMRRAGMTQDDVQGAIAAANADKQGVFTVADALGNAGQRGLSGIARQPGDASRQSIFDFLQNRQAGQGDRLSGFVADALDAPDTAAARAARLTGERSAAANTAYAAAREGAAPVDVRDVLAVIDDRIGPMSGMGVTGDGIDATLGKFRNRLAAPEGKLPNGSTAVELSDFDRVLKVKQDLGDAIGEATRAGRNNEVRELMKVQSALDAALEGSSPAYRSANDEFARASRAIDAVDKGKAATSGRVRAEDTAGMFGAMPPEQQSAFRAGYADPLIAKFDASATGVNKARPLSGGKTAKDMETLAIDPALIQRQIARENTMFETGNAALGGSKTADNLADAKDMAGYAVGPVSNLLQGRLGTAATQVMSGLASAAKGTNPATREIIAKALLSQDPQAVLLAAKRVGVPTELARQMVEALMRGGAMRGPQ